MNCHFGKKVKNTMLPGKQLFWGDNGVHEFWESEDSELLILRNHGEAHWTAHRNHGYLFSCPSAPAAAARLNVNLSETHTWVREKSKFELRPCARPTTSPSQPLLF